MKGLIFVALVLFLSFNAEAKLGGNESSISKDKSKLGCSDMSVSEQEKFKVYTLQCTAADSNETQTIKEFLDPASGKVFEITWEGPAHANLHILLGKYSSRFEKASKENLARGRPRIHTIPADNLVVRKWGHMRLMGGRAFDSSLLPPGVDGDEIE